jgi:hypothetical protein
LADAEVFVAVACVSNAGKPRRAKRVGKQAGLFEWCTFACIRWATIANIAGDALSESIDTLGPTKCVTEWISIKIEIGCDTAWIAREADRISITISVTESAIRIYIAPLHIARFISCSLRPLTRFANVSREKFSKLDGHERFTCGDALEEITRAVRTRACIFLTNRWNTAAST